MTKLGMGMMRLPLLDENDQTSIDIEHVNKMVDATISTLHLFIMKGQANRHSKKPLLTDIHGIHLRLLQNFRCLSSQRNPSWSLCLHSSLKTVAWIILTITCFIT